MTQSYHPTWDETPLSVNEYRKLYGSWFTLVSGANSYMTPEFVEFRDKENGSLLAGWGLPGIEDICQLVGQAPRNSNSVHWDVLNFVGASNNDAPSNHNSQWYGEFQNISGLTLTPLGSREPIQGDLSNSFYAHKLLSKLRLSGGANERSFSFYISGSAFNDKDYHYSQVRYCRTKTDEELGYKMYVNNCDDEILILYPDEETEYPELPVGLERGIALKYFDREARLVDRRWSEIQEEAVEYRSAFQNLPAAPSLTFPQCNTTDGSIEPDPYERGEEGSVHIWISELGSDGDGVGFLAYDFDKMEERGTNSGFQGTYRTIEIGEYEYTTQNLKAIHRERWGTDFKWLNWTDANITSITSSYDPRYDETPLSINKFQNFYGNWFTLLSSVVSYRNPNLCVFRSKENGVALSGWGLPSSNDMMQMAGQTPRFTNSLNHNLLEFMGAGQSDSPSGHITEWPTCKNVSGLTLTPLGGREPVPGDLTQHIYAHKKLSTLRLQEYTSTFTVGTIGTGYSSYSYQYGQVRYCRAKTDEELGYKMYIDEKSNRVVMLPYGATSNLTELPKGVERGVALRYTNRQHMRVLKKWTDIQEEADAIRKTLTGEYTPLPDDNIDDDDYYDQDRDDDDEGDDNGEDGGDDGDDKEIVNEISYAYDLSGNRVKRELLLSASPEIRTATQEPEKEQPVYEILEKQKIIIYPNPTKGELMIEISNYSQENNYSVSITDLNGRTIINQQITGIQTHLNIQEHASGVYLMKLNVNGKTSTWKIIKE